MWHVYVGLIECLKCLQFYFKNGRPPPNELKQQCLARIDQLFFGHADGLQIQGDKAPSLCSPNCLRIELEFFSLL